MNEQIDPTRFGKGFNIIGIIGKNGKSTLAQMIHHCYLALEIANELESATEFFKKMHTESYEKSIKDVIIEVSVCEIKAKKASYIDFGTLIFTNSSKNADMDELWTMRRPFIALPIVKTAIVNIDDEHGENVCDVTVAKIMTYGLGEAADLQARNIRPFMDKTTFDLYYEGNFTCNVEIPYFGIYNVYNSLATIAYFISEGYKPERIVQLLPNLPKIEGKFDLILTDTDISVIIDYARNPEAIESVLTALGTICEGDVITVVGADGNERVAERASIGKVVLAHSKQVIITNDNPRMEEPQNIIYDLIKGSVRQNYRICMDREKAIEIALKMAKPKDVVVILGRGHEKTQIIGEKVTVFCDKTVAKYLIQKFEI